MNPNQHDGFFWLWRTYAFGAVMAILAIFGLFDRPGYHGTDGFYAATGWLYVVMGALILATSYLAIKKGREFVEGAVLGSFGPIGFIIEVLLPPIDSPRPRYEKPTETVEAIQSGDAFAKPGSSLWSPVPMVILGVVCTFVIAFIVTFIQSQ